MTMSAKIANTSNVGNEYLRVKYRNGYEHELAPGEYLTKTKDHENSAINPPGLEGITKMEFFIKDGVEAEYSSEGPTGAGAMEKGGFKMKTDLPDRSPETDAPPTDGSDGKDTPKADAEGKAADITKSDQFGDRDIRVHGDPDMWRCVCKASEYVRDGLAPDADRVPLWMKSTKILEVEGVGVMVQVTTEHYEAGAVSSCAEAVAFYPGVKWSEEEGKLVPMKPPVTAELSTSA